MGERTHTWDHGQVPRPATGKTPVRHVRVADAIWAPALAKARAEGRTLSAVIVEFLEGYVGKQDQSGEKVEKRTPADPTEPR